VNAFGVGILLIAVFVIGLAILFLLHASRRARAGTKVCGHCQQHAPLEARFCPRCGHQFTAASEPRS
jgi:predicted amidophosphoribosyltransferase